MRELYPLRGLPGSFFVTDDCVEEGFEVEFCDSLYRFSIAALESDFALNRIFLINHLFGIGDIAEMEAFEQMICGIAHEDRSVFENDDAIDESFEVADLMCRDDDKALGSILFSEVVSEDGFARDIEAVGGFIHEQNFGVAGQSEGHVCLFVLSLTHAAERLIGFYFEAFEERLKPAF